MQFIEAALSCTSPSALSYADPNQKWIIRQHLVSLLQDFPSLKPAMDTFTHNDGTTVNLLNANGEIHVSSSKPPILLTIWLHQNYPTMAPLVFVSSSNHSFPIYSDHPFVEQSSGATTSPYLVNWNPGCNLSELVNNLVKLLSHNHPFYYSPSPWITHPSFVSKREAMDRLACTLYYDMMDLRSKTQEEIEELSSLQSELQKRADIATSVVIGLEHEHENLKQSVRKLTDEADVLLNWLKVYNKNSAIAIVGDDIDGAFECVDEKSRVVLECLAADNTMEDLMYELDKAVEQGIFSFDVYVKQVRSLARNQFEYRAKRLKLERSWN